MSELAPKSLIAGFINTIMKEAMEHQNKLIVSFLRAIPELSRANYFQHGGNAYKLDTLTEVVVQQGLITHIPRIPLNYLNEFKTLYRKKTNLLAESLKITQVMLTVVSSCKTEQDLRDALPEILVMGALAEIPRTRPEGYTITSELHLQQFNKYRDKLYTYAAYKFLG